MQRVNGIDVFGNGVKVNVAKDGRIINVTGSPVASLAGAPAATPGISAVRGGSRREAERRRGRRAGRVDVGRVTSSTNVLVGRRRRSSSTSRPSSGLTLAYRTLLVDDGYLVVVDAASGKVLYRDSFTDSANGLAWDNRPGTVAGGTQRSFDVNGPGGTWGFGAFNAVIGMDAGPLEQQRLGVQRRQRKQRRQPAAS